MILCGAFRRLGSGNRPQSLTDFGYRALPDFRKIVNVS